MSSDLQEIFRLNEPEVVLESFSEDRGAIFRLLDCDGYRLGCMVCEDVYALCMTIRWESFSSVSFLQRADVDVQFPVLSHAVPNGFQLVVLHPVEDATSDSKLPTIKGEKLGYIICKSVSFVKETERGR